MTACLEIWVWKRQDQADTNNEMVWVKWQTLAKINGIMGEGKKMKLLAER